MRDKRPHRKAPTGPASEPARSRGDVARHLPAIGIVLAVAFGAYANALNGGFAFDSKGLVLEDARVHDATGANAALIVQHTYWWPRGESGLYRPLTTFSYLFNYAILGNADRPFGYHAVNVLLHAANALLAYALAVELFGVGSSAALVAILWAAHPLATEAVTNIAGRPDLMAAFGVLTALLCFGRSVRTSGPSARAWQFGVLIAAAAGVASKESAAVIVVLIPLYEFAAGQNRRRPAITAGWAAAAVGIALVLLQRQAVLAAAPAAEFPYTDNPIIGAGFWTSRLTALTVAGRYLWLFAWPARLSADYSFDALPFARGSLIDGLAWATVAVGVTASVLTFRRSRVAFFGLVFAAVSLLPASNLLFVTGTIMGERLMYLPSAGLTITVVAAVEAVASRTQLKRLAVITISVLALACAARTIYRNTDWYDDLAIWRAAERAYPQSYKVHRGVAAALAARDTAHAEIAAIVAEGDRAVAILDPLPDARNDASAYRDAGGYHLVESEVAEARGVAAAVDAVSSAKAAIPLLRRYVAIAAAAGGRPASPTTTTAATELVSDGYRLLSIAYLKSGDAAAALDAAARARSLDPLHPGGYKQTAAALLAGRRPKEAAVWLLAGAIVTGNPGLRMALANLYRQSLDPDRCAIAPGSTEVLNPACPAVRETMCAAAVETIRIERATGRADLADALRAATREQFKCDPGS